MKEREFLFNLNGLIKGEFFNIETDSKIVIKEIIKIMDKEETEPNSQEDKTKQSLPMTAKVDRHSSIDKLDKTLDIHSEIKDEIKGDYQ